MAEYEVITTCKVEGFGLAVEGSKITLDLPLSAVNQVLVDNGSLSIKEEISVKTEEKKGKEIKK